MHPILWYVCNTNTILYSLSDMYATDYIYKLLMMYLLHCNIVYVFLLYAHNYVCMFFFL